MAPRRIVLASNNASKLVELRALFEPLGLELIGQAELGIDEASEPHATFVENALAKARHAAAASGLAAIADDSGLCVDALGGAPGVRSARYAAQLGVESDATSRDADNNGALLAQMASLHGENARRARFVCALVAVLTVDDPEPLIAIGRWNGRVLEVQRGDAGFGYDPLFEVDALGVAAAEMSACLKNAHSHRGMAARRMQRLLRDVWRVSAGANHRRTCS